MSNVAFAADLVACLANATRACLVAEGRSAAQSIAQEFWRAKALLEIAQMQVETGRLDEARTSVALARATWTFMGERDDPELRDLDLGTDRDFIGTEIVKVQVALGDIAAANVTVAAISGEQDRRWGAGPEIARGLARQGDIDGALEIALALDPGQLRDRTVAAIGLAQLDVGDPDGAMRTMRLAGGEGLAIAQRVALDLVRENNIAGARAITDTLDEAWERSSVRAEIAQQQIWDGDLRGAEETARSIEDTFYRSVAALALVRAYAERGELASARAHARQVTDPVFTKDVHAPIAVALAKGGLLDEAIVEAQRVDGYQRQLALMGIGEVISEQDTGRAIGIAEGLEPYDRAQALRKIARRQQDDRAPGGARETLRVAQNAAALVADKSSKWVALRSVAMAWAEIGEHEEALVAVHVINDLEKRAEVFRDLGMAQHLAGATEAAWRTLAMAAFASRAILNDERRDDTSHTVAVTQAQAGDNRGAAATLDRLSPYRKALALAKIALSLPAADPRI